MYDRLLAFIGAVPLVLGESYIIIMFLTRTYLIGQASTDLFDAVSPLLLLSQSSTSRITNQYVFPC
jgi:hypothetical protein